jgi:hypothetical protein
MSNLLTGRVPHEYDGCTGPFVHAPSTDSQWFSAIQIGLITATIWVLFLNALIGFQWLDDGTPTSIFVWPF